MKAEQIARDNKAFFNVGIGVTITRRDFGHAIRDSYHQQPLQYAMVNRLYDGYILIDTSDIVRNCSHGSLSDDIGSGILGKVALLLPEKVSGVMNSEASVDLGIYTFAFKITKYERSANYNYEMVEDPTPIPKGEVLGRFVELKISIAAHR
ncbi:MAG: hypothetical protein RIQ41_248 [Candidatus Parcubacteria bacterium]|jgi:hypothetical protein